MKLVAEQRFLIWNKIEGNSAKWEAEQRLIQAEANRKRSEAAKNGKVGRASVKNEKFSATTSSGTTKQNHQKGEIAKATASSTNRGATAVRRSLSITRATPSTKPLNVPFRLTG